MSLPPDATAGHELATFQRFCARLTVKEGGPLLLEPFQLLLLTDYFAGVIETLCLLPKKNGKTTLLAALALFHLVSRTGEDPECVVGAASRDQASVLYEQAVGLIDRSAGLQRRLVAKGGYREIRSRNDRGRIRVLAADADTADGIIPTLALMDELHRQKSTGLYAVFRDGLGPRDGQMVTISTAGDHERSPLGQLRKAAHRLPSVERQEHYRHHVSADGSFALHEWALPATADLDDLRLVKLVNPSSWQTVEKLAQRHSSPSTMPWEWARFACGVWTGAEAWWVRPEDWEDTTSEEQLRPGDRITLGFDGSRYGDATGLVACRMEDGLVQPLGLWEAPSGVQEWEVPAGAVDATLAAAMETFRVVRGYFDPPLWQSEIDGWARQYGDMAVTRYPTNRTRFMAAAERFRTDVLSRTLAHSDDGDLARHVLNAQMREARGGYWLAKGTSADRIDLAIAAVLAYEARCDANAQDTTDRSEFAFL